MAAFKLQIGFSPECRTRRNRYDALVNIDPSKGLRHSVHSRNNWTCTACGFASERYMEVSPLCKTPLLASDYITLCRFCWQVGNLDYAALQRSAELVWMPELEQTEINFHMPALYAETYRIRSEHRDAITRIFGVFKLRRKDASIRLAGKEEVHLPELLSEDECLHPSFLDKLDDGYRVWPLERWNLQVGSLEFNQYPAMSAFWRSRNGPFFGGCKSLSNTAPDWLERLHDSVFG